jgi:hypothetical protein
MRFNYSGMRLGNIGTFTVRFELIDPGAMGAPGVQRAALSGAGKLPSEPAVYCIFDGAQSEPVPVYVGETSRLSARATSHLAARWPMRDPWIAYRAFPGAPKHVLHELESDVLGWCFWRARQAPSCPYRAEHSHPAVG